jgi:hypothetical protein
MVPGIGKPKFFDIIKLDPQCTYSFTDSYIPKDLIEPAHTDIIAISCRLPVLMAPTIFDAGKEILTVSTPGGWNYKRNEIQLDIKGTQPPWSYFFSLILALSATSILSYCFAIRTYQVKDFKALPMVRWCKYPSSWRLG